jgi:hypothetical protein
MLYHHYISRLWSEFEASILWFSINKLEICGAFIGQVPIGTIYILLFNFNLLEMARGLPCRVNRLRRAITKTRRGCVFAKGPIDRPVTSPKDPALPRSCTFRTAARCQLVCARPPLRSRARALPAFRAQSRLVRFLVANKALVGLQSCSGRRNCRFGEALWQAGASLPKRP